MLSAVLQPFARATTGVSAEKSPSAGMAFALYEHLMEEMESKSMERGLPNVWWLENPRRIALPDFAPPKTVSPAVPAEWVNYPLVQQHLAAGAWSKLRKWYSSTDRKVLSIAAVMDPRIRIKYFREGLKWNQKWINNLQEYVCIHFGK